MIVPKIRSLFYAFTPKEVSMFLFCVSAAGSFALANLRPDFHGWYQWSMFLIGLSVNLSTQLLSFRRKEKIGENDIPLPPVAASPAPVIPSDVQAAGTTITVTPAPIAPPVVAVTTVAPAHEVAAVTTQPPTVTVQPPPTAPAENGGTPPAKP